MYDQIREDIFFIMLYGAAAMLSLAACSTPIHKLEKLILNH